MVHPGRFFFRRVLPRAVATSWSALALPFALTLALTLALALAAADAPRALSPAESLAAFQLEPGLKIELVAAEPLVVAPAAFAFDERGRLYVAENRDYPDAPSGAAPQGRIVLLEDTDGDGRFDKRTEFATGLTYPNGVACWRGGVFVTCAPDILFLKDTDGDGVADERRVVLTGFDTSKSTQLRASHPTLGPDGKFYVTCGLAGGKITSPAHPERAAVNFSASDGRFDPATFVFETTGGRGQFGLSFDAFGRRFVCSNRHPILQVVLEPWHLKRNPDLAFTETTQAVSKVEADARAWPISGAAVTADFIPNLMRAPHTGTFTSACAVTVFGGDGLTDAHRGNVFVCEPAQNLVQRQLLRPDGAAFRAEPATEGREFLASTDTWFRPVFLGGGPDGALYVADMHRKEIDHPVYVPAESRALLDFESGKNTGRIYRITRASTPAAGGRPAGPTRAASAHLSSPDAWQRETARRLLLENANRDRGEVLKLEKIAALDPQPESRAAALDVLRAWGTLRPAALSAAFRDPDARVREVAVHHAGETLGGAPELLELLRAAARDGDARVRFAAALAFGPVRDATVLPGLAAIALRDGDDRWTRAAVLSGVGGRAAEFQSALRALPDGAARTRGALLRDIGKLLGTAGDPKACGDFLAPLLRGDADLAWRVPAVLGLAEGLAGGGATRARKPALATLGGEALAAFFVSTAARAADASATSADRLAAVALLGFGGYETSAPLLAQLLDARQPPDVQLASVRALERLADPRGAEVLTAPATWAQFSPAVREAAIATLTSRPPLIAGLFAAIARGTVAPGELSSARRAQLLKHADATVRAGAEKVFRALEGGDRMAVYQGYRDCLDLPGDAARGREVFLRACSACHTHRGAGGKVGPDLTGLRNQPATAILLHILVPNYEVAPAYQAMTATARDGRAVTGWLVAETDAGVTLRTAAGVEETLLRRDLATLVASGVSLMPDGLEQAVPKPAMADLLAYLKEAPR
ncbi:MAG: hypothetical protein RLZZ15_1181 [Verrucomicrobiota bacterium]|jgi:putative membrane-bound dehydrogenase-like protein